MSQFKKEMLGVVSEGSLKEVDLATALINTYYRMRQLGFIEYKDIDALHVNDLEFFRRMIASDKMDMGEQFIKSEFWYIITKLRMRLTMYVSHMDVSILPILTTRLA